MIIQKPKIKIEKNEILVSTEIKFQNQDRTKDIPKEIWFKFPKEYKKFVSKSSDGFIISLLPLAMSLGENIEVKGALSPKLFYNLKEYQRILNFWFPKKFRVVNIKCNFKKNKNSGAVGCTFSGGVDSFYTLWKHLPRNEKNPDYQISHIIFIHGFDIPLEDEKSYQEIKKSYEELAKKLKIKFLTIKTNSRDFVKELDWELIHGSTLIGAALIFSIFKRIYIAAKDSYEYLPPRGIHPILDPLLSTDSTEIIHHGASISRVEKTKIISSWPETYSRLRVCWENINGLKNCSECEKCTRTMAILDMFGVLQKYTTFPLQLKRKNIRKAIFDEETFHYPKEIISYAEKIGRKDIAFDFKYALLKSKILDKLKLIKLK